VAFALPLLGLGGALLFAPGAFRERRRLAGLLVASSVLGLLPVLAWGLLADAATNGRFLSVAIGTHVIGRTLAAMEGHRSGLLVGPLYYGVVLVVGFAPFTLFLPSAWLRVRSGGGLAPGARAILLGSALAPFLLFTVVATKLPHYLLPAFPALALLAAEAAAAGERRGFVAGGLLLAPVVVVALAALGFVVAVPPLAALRAPAAAAFVAITAETVLAAAFLRSGRSRAAAATLLVGTSVALAATVGLGLPAIEAWKPVPRLAAEARRLVGDAPAATLGFEEPSVFVHFGPGPVERLASEADAARWARREGPGLLVTTRSGLESLVAREGLLPLVPVAWRGGMNVSKGTPVELVALARGGPWAKSSR
jgi:4-amino-4-deoxy-L-arabinose transferase-like glycosyltransferase